MVSRPSRSRRSRASRRLVPRAGMMPAKNLISSGPRPASTAACRRVARWPLASSMVNEGGADDAVRVTSGNRGAVAAAFRVGDDWLALLGRWDPERSPRGDLPASHVHGPDQPSRPRRVRRRTLKPLPARQPAYPEGGRLFSYAPPVAPHISLPATPLAPVKESAPMVNHRGRKPRRDSNPHLALS